MLKHDRSHANLESHDHAIRATRSSGKAFQDHDGQAFLAPRTGRCHRPVDAGDPRRPVAEFLHGDRTVLLVRWQHRRLGIRQHHLFPARPSHLPDAAHRVGARRRRACGHPVIRSLRLSSGGGSDRNLLSHRMAAEHQQALACLGTHVAAIYSHTICACRRTLLDRRPHVYPAHHHAVHTQLDRPRAHHVHRMAVGAGHPAVRVRRRHPLASAGIQLGLEPMDGLATAVYRVLRLRPDGYLPDRALPVAARPDLSDGSAQSRTHRVLRCRRRRIPVFHRFK